MSDVTQQREDFTSEVFKIEITNCVYFGFGVSYIYIYNCYRIYIF